jgi:hypothetical protein
MKALVLKTVLAVAAVTGTSVFADGFTCENLDENVRIHVYNKVNADEGTRNVAVMVVSDPSISAGKKTTAKFDADTQPVNNQGALYVAKVDLRFNNDNLKGRNFAGTKLGNVDTITLDVDFSYAQPIENGEQVDGQLIVAKRNGTDDNKLSVTCTRYLKGSK